MNAPEQFPSKFNAEEERIDGPGIPSSGGAEFEKCSGSALVS
jgi:hypothetical protein